MNAANLVQWLDSSSRNQWITIGPFSVYLRKAHRLVLGNGSPTQMHVVDLASVNNETNGLVRTGQLPQLLSVLEAFVAHRGFDGLYVENVLVDFLYPMLLRAGYVHVPSYTNGASCFFKQLNNRS